MRRNVLLAVLVTIPLLLGAAPLVLAATSVGGVPALGAYVASRYDFGLPAWAPAPLEPEGNQTTPAKVELGRRLFYDTRLSSDGSMSCASCHRQELAFTDARSTSPGVTGQRTSRNAMSLANVGYTPVLTWANPLMHSLEQQALVPLVGQAPVELGLAGMDEQVRARLQSERLYLALFREAFPEARGEISLATITRALAAFERTLVSVRSPYDRYRYGGDVSALSESAIRGEALFFSERLECHHCHGGLLLTDTVMSSRNRVGEIAFHNTGLYNIDGRGAYPSTNRGIAEVTGRPEDMGRFRAPSLRNIAVTAPYMHDGSIATLDEVIDHYVAGGRTIVGGPYAGVGRDSPLKSSFVRGFELSAEERRDLVAFLESLTDEQFLSDPRHANPWLRDQTPVSNLNRLLVAISTAFSFNSPSTATVTGLSGYLPRTATIPTPPNSRHTSPVTTSQMLQRGAPSVFAGGSNGGQRRRLCQDNWVQPELPLPCS